MRRIELFKEQVSLAYRNEFNSHDLSAEGRKKHIENAINRFWSSADDYKQLELKICISKHFQKNFVDYLTKVVPVYSVKDSLYTWFFEDIYPKKLYYAVLLPMFAEIVGYIDNAVTKIEIANMGYNSFDDDDDAGCLLKIIDKYYEQDNFKYSVCKLLLMKLKYYNNVTGRASSASILKPAMSYFMSLYNYESIEDITSNVVKAIDNFIEFFDRDYTQMEALNLSQALNLSTVEQLMF